MEGFGMGSFIAGLGIAAGFFMAGSGIRDYYQAEAGVLSRYCAPATGKEE